MPSYEFGGRGNYGGEVVSSQDLIRAYEAAPACHHPGKTLGRVAIEQIDDEVLAAIIADDILTQEPLDPDQLLG